jgi:hypothetical protein
VATGSRRIHQMQKRKIIAVILVAAIIIVAIFGYEFFVANSLSGYTKVSITSSQPISVNFGNTVSVKVDNTVYYITYLHTQNGTPTSSGSQNSVFQVLINNNSSKGFGAIQGAKYSFSGLQIVVGSVNNNQLILYVKSTFSTSEPIISSLATATPVSVYNYSFSVLNPQVTKVFGYSGFYDNVSQGMPLEVNMTFNSRTDQPITIPIENLSVSYYNSTVNLNRWLNNNGNYSNIQQQAFSYSFNPNSVTIQPYESNSTILTIDFAKNAPTGQYSLEINLGKPEVTIDNSNLVIPYSELDGLEIIVTPVT